MPQRKGLLAPQNTFLDTIATRFDGTHSNFVLGNAQAKDHPIVYCSDGFCELTKYPRSFVMSRSCACHFLWGDDTDDPERTKIEASLANHTELKSELIFYKKSGSPFVCLLDIVPIKNEKGQVVLFLASHKDVTREKMVAGKLPISFPKDTRLSVPSINEEPFTNESGLIGDENSSSYKYERRRSRAVLYHLQGQFDSKPKSKIKLKRQLSNLTGKNMPEYKVEEMNKSCFILLHYGLFKIIWDWLLLVCTFYIAAVVPYNAAFDRLPVEKSLDYCDIIVEILLIVDIIFNFRTTFVSKGGQVVYHTKWIALNYMKGWFLLDLLAGIPFDLFIQIFSLNTTALLGINTWPIDLMKLGRLVRLARLLQKIDRYSQYSAVVLGLLMFMFALCAHWLACIWYVIGIKELKQIENDKWQAGWLYDLSEKLLDPYSNNRTGGPQTQTLYITALYFTCSSLTSVGFGNVSANTNNEKIFSICAMLIGALMHAVVFGNVTAIIQRMYSRRAAYQTKTRDLKDFTRTHHIPKPLKQRMQEFFQTMWSINRGIDPKMILHDFPEELRGDIATHLHREMLSLPVFESASQGCLKSLAQEVKTTFCTPGEHLIYSGDVIKYIYLVCSGSLEILENNEVVALLGKGDLFGSDLENISRSSRSPLRSRCDVKSLTYCDLQCIELKGLLNILDQYPEFKSHFCADLQMELSFNIKDGAQHGRLESLSSGSQALTLPSISEDDEVMDPLTDRYLQLEDPPSEDGGGPSSRSGGRRLSCEERMFLLQDSTVENGSTRADTSSVFSSDMSYRRRNSSPPPPRFDFSAQRGRRQSADSTLRRLRSSGKASSLSDESICSMSKTSEFFGIMRNMQRLERQVDGLRSNISTISSNVEEVLAFMKRFYGDCVVGAACRGSTASLVQTATPQTSPAPPQVHLEAASPKCETPPSFLEGRLIPARRPPSIKFLAPQHHSNTLPTSSMLASDCRLSPHSLSSGFGSNHEDLSPNVHTLLLSQPEPELTTPQSGFCPEDKLSMSSTQSINTTGAGGGRGGGVGEGQEGQTSKRESFSEHLAPLIKDSDV